MTGIEFVTKVVTKDKVCVDSVIHNEWYSDKHGVKKIVARDRGVTIYTNVNSTFVPWHNVAYTQGATDSRFNDVPDAWS